MDYRNIPQWKRDRMREQYFTYGCTISYLAGYMRLPEEVIADYLLEPGWRERGKAVDERYKREEAIDRKAAEIAAQGMEGERVRVIGRDAASGRSMHLYDAASFLETTPDELREALDKGPARFGHMVARWEQEAARRAFAAAMKMYSGE